MKRVIYVLLLVAMTWSGLTPASAAEPDGTFAVAVERSDAGFIIRGSLTASNEQLSGLSVDLVRAGDEGIVASAIMRADGSVEFLRGGNEAGQSYRLRATTGSATYRSAAVTLSIATSSLIMTVPQQTPAKAPFDVSFTLTSGGQPLANRNVEVVFGAQAARAVVTDAAGIARISLTSRGGGRASITARFAGDATHRATERQTWVYLGQQPFRVSLSTPGSTRDGDALKAVVKLSDVNGKPLNAKVEFRVHEATSGVRRSFVRQTSGGAATLKVRIYRSAYVRVYASEQNGYAGARSSLNYVRLTPAGTPVRLKGAPAPYVKVPAQPVATTGGADIRTSAVPESVWRDMQGKTWRPGCLARNRLRYITTNYWSFDGYRRRGELVVAADIAYKYERALNNLYYGRHPLRSMYRVDRFGYSAKLRGGNDYGSMAADNTSAFNCRDVVGSPGIKSPHSTGRSFDLNPWENPYLSGEGWTPNTYWVNRSEARVAWRYAGHPVVQALYKAGFRWTYGVYDAQHFDG